MFNRAPEETRVFLDKPVSLDHKDHRALLGRAELRDSVENLARGVNLEPTDNLDSKDRRAREDLKDNRALLDLVDNQDRTDSGASQDQLEHLEATDNLVGVSTTLIFAPDLLKLLKLQW